MIPRALKPYAKAVVAVGGVGAMVWMHSADVRLPGFDYLVQDMIVGALVSWGVYRVPNSQKPVKK